jgi:hypothetical protein
VPVVFLIAIIAVLAGVFLAATGRGGELAYERPDHAPLDLGPVSAPDVAMLRPPTAMWGYNIHVTDEALDLIVRAMRDRDVTIAYLQQQLANRVSADPGPLPVRQTAGYAAADEALPEVGNPDAPPSPRAAKAPGVLVAPLPPKATQPWVIAPPPEATQPIQPLQPAQEAQATQPSQTLPGPYDVQGPQGAYDTHGWWAQQEEAAREEEARRQAAAQEADQTRPDEANPPGATAPETTAPEADPFEADPFEADPPEADPPEASAPEAGSPSGQTGTLPNPIITSPAGTATSSDQGDRPATSSVEPVQPNDDTLGATEEQAW